jgi:hypothetical protein
VVREANYVAHFAAHGSQHGLNVLQGLADLCPHVTFADDATFPVQGHLPFEMHDPPVALNYAHREHPERLPYAWGIEAVDHRGFCLDTLYKSYIRFQYGQEKGQGHDVLRDAARS